MSPFTYKKAGVDIDKADTFIKTIKPLLKKAIRPEVLGRIGGFSGLFMPRLGRMKKPVLVSATDGVGTKLMIAELMKKYDTVGVDLVAMCADDVVVVGAEPLFFLDYIACGKLNVAKLYELMKGIAAGCREAGCALIGGETAELPGMYASDTHWLLTHDTVQWVGNRYCQGTVCVLINEISRWIADADQNVDEGITGQRSTRNGIYFVVPAAFSLGNKAKSGSECLVREAIQIHPFCYPSSQTRGFLLMDHYDLFDGLFILIEGQYARDGSPQPGAGKPEGNVLFRSGVVGLVPARFDLHIL